MSGGGVVPWWWRLAGHSSVRLERGRSGDAPGAVGSGGESEGE
jgi:hypothetical protein